MFLAQTFHCFTAVLRRARRPAAEPAAPRGLARRSYVLLLSLLVCSPSIAAPASIDFGGARLQQQRSGSAPNGRFSEYGRNGDGTAEMLTVRVMSDKTPLPVRLSQLVKSIKAGNPGVKLHVLERRNVKNDVIVSYLADRPNSNVSLVLWRLTAAGDDVVAAIYQMDFDIGDDDARDRVTGHDAERALAALGTEAMLELVSDAK